MRNFDLQEIDNEDKYDFFHLHYLERIRGVVKVAERYYSAKKVLEVGFVRSNISLLLAQSGFFSMALDINVEFLKYSRAKYKSGY